MDLAHAQITNNSSGIIQEARKMYIVHLIVPQTKNKLSQIPINYKHTMAIKPRTLCDQYVFADW